MGAGDDDDDRYRPVQEKPRHGRAPVRNRGDLRKAVSENMAGHAKLDAGDGLLSLAAMAKESVPLRQWLVPDLIPKDNVTQFAGDGGLGKSLLMLQLLAATALNLPWLGRRVNGGRGLGVFCEDDIPEIHRRMYEICAAYGCDMADLDENLLLVSRVAEDNALMTFSRWGEEPPQETVLYKKIAATVATFGPSLIVLDSSHDLFIGNENDRTQVRQFVGALRKLCRDNGASLVLNSHPSLNGLSSGTGQSGSTAWHNAVRARVYLARPEGQTAGNQRVLYTKKMNYGSSDGEIGLEWENGVFVCTDAVGTPATAMMKLHTGEALEMVIDEVREMCETGTYPSSSDNHPTLYIGKLLSKRPKLRGFDKRNLENLVQEGLRKGLLESAVAPRSRRGKFRPVVVHKGFKVPQQAAIVFVAPEADPARAAVTIPAAEANVTAARGSAAGKETGGPPDLEEPPDEAYEDLERFNRGED